MRRSVRTVQRWERTGDLPVHRHPDAASGGVFAFRWELDSWWGARRHELDAEPERGAVKVPVIAVLPIDDMSAARDCRPLCEALMDELISALASSADVRVIARTATMQWCLGHALLPRSTGMFGADLFIEGSITATAASARVNVRLFGSVAKEVRWAERYERPREDMADALPAIAASVVRDVRTLALEPRLRCDRQAV